VSRFRHHLRTAASVRGCENWFTTMAFLWICCEAEPEAMMIAADTTLANPDGKDVRSAAGCMFARPSGSEVIEKI